ncbi:helix-turn-helix domain-containing protein [bacterium]|nr:helix-turn-helix domain-containing protein [bacterium]
MNKTIKHYHYVDSPTMPHRLVIELDPAKAPGMPYGMIDPVYDPPSVEPDFISNQLENIQPFVRNGTLVIQGVFDPETVITIAPDEGYVLEKIVLDDVHDLVELVNERGMLYWIKVGRSGAFRITAQVVKDEEGDTGKIEKLRTHIGDIPLREYLARKARARIDKISEEDFEEYPSTLDTETAARYLGRSRSWLYDKAQKGMIRRTPDKHFLRDDLDEYQRRKPEAKKKRGGEKKKH